MSFRFEKRSAGQQSAGGANLCWIVRWLGEENESIDAHAGKRRPILRVSPQPGRGEPSEDAEAEARGIPPRCSALVASDAPQLGELRVASLCVEAVAVLAGNRGHAWAEAADHDGRGGIAGGVAGGSIETIVSAGDARGTPRPKPAENLRRLRDPLGAHGICLDAEPQPLLLPCVRRAAAASRAQAHDETPARDLLE